MNEQYRQEVELFLAFVFIGFRKHWLDCVSHLPKARVKCEKVQGSG